jgi:hypothetical protein
MLVKPVNTPDLLRQIEALLVSHEDQKRAAAQTASASSALSSTPGKRKAV